MSNSIPQTPDTLQAAHQATEAAEERFELLVNSVRDYGIFLIDQTGYIQSWNIGAERIKGYTAQEAIGKHFSIFYTEADQARNHPQHELEIAIREGRYEEEGWRVRKDGSQFWSNVVITPLKNKANQFVGFAKVTRDLTERKKMDDLLKNANAMLEKRVKERTNALSHINQQLQDAVRVRDDFLSIASHELRTPLTPLKLQTQVLFRNICKKSLSELDDERLEKMANTCEKAISRLSNLIDNLLDVSRINARKLLLNYESFSLNEMCEDLLERFKSEIESYRSEAHFQSEAEIVGTFDRIRLEQVFLNLLTNAAKYGAEKPFQISISQIENEALIVFKDSGIGIEKSNIPKIFERFERLDLNDSVGGMGLGLYITRQIVEAHGGSISVESSVGTGSTFTVRIPLNASRK